jgi:hypothetical protein
MMRDNLKKDERYTVWEHIMGLNDERHPAPEVSLIHYSSSYLIFTGKQ